MHLEPEFVGYVRFGRAPVAQRTLVCDKRNVVVKARQDQGWFSRASFVVVRLK